MAKKIVCKGIVSRTGFNVYPQGESPVYVQFDPETPTEVTDDIAEHLSKLDKNKFVIVDEQEAPKEAVAVTAEGTEAQVPTLEQGGLKRHGKNNREKRANQD